jgi:hypothetical protein
VKLDVRLAGIHIHGWRGVAILAGAGLVIAAVARELSKPRGERQWTGRVAGFVPYDFRPPTVNRLRQSIWDPESRRLLTPRAFGVGWSVNLAEVSRRGGLQGHRDWRLVDPAQESDIRDVVHETLEENPTAGFREVLAAWHVRRGTSIDDAEAARVAEVYEREAPSLRANRFGEEAATASGPETTVPDDLRPSEEEQRLAS